MQIIADFSPIFISVNGNWGAWLKLSGCSASCNGGIKARVRYCNDPSPDPYGLDCIGKNVSEDVCNTQECPGKVLV